MLDRMRDNKTRIIKISVIILVILLILGGFLVATEVKDVDVEDGNHYSSQEIKDYLISSRLEHNSLYLYFKNRYGTQVKIPFVEYVDVELKGINRIKFTVYEKDTAGCIDYMNKYIYFDKDGYFVEQSDEKLEDVIYITGLKCSSMTLHEKMNVDDDSLFDVIMNLTKLIDKYNIEIEEINFNANSEVTMYSGDIEILLGKHDTYDEQIAKLVGLLESAEGMSGTFHLENFDKNDDNIIFNKK